MLIKNNKLFNPGVKKGDEDYETAERYNTEVSSLIKKHGTRLIFKRTRKYSMSKNGLRMPMPPMILPLRGSRTVDGKPEEWMYVEGLPPKKDGVFDQRQRGLMIGAEKVIDMEKQPDLGWFLYYISPLMNKEIVLYDPKLEHRQKADQRRMAVALENALFGDSPLSDSGVLKTVAEAWGVNSFHKDPDELRFELESLLKRRDNEKLKDTSVRGSKEFLKDIKIIGTVTFKKSFLQRGVSSDIIKIEKSGDVVMTATGEKLLFVPPEKLSDWFDYFAEHVIKNEPLFKKLVKANANNGYIDDATDVSQLEWLFKFVGKPITKKTMPTIKRELKGHLA